VNKDKQASYLWMYAILALVAIVLATVASFLVRHGDVRIGWGLSGTAALILAALMVALPVVLSVESARKAIEKHQDDVLRGFNEQLQQVCLLLNLMNENLLISDRTKAVAYREKDRDAIRRAVQEELARQDWEAALALVNDMEKVFGYKAEADRFRADIATKRQDVVQKQIGDQMQAVDRYINGEAWSQALQEAQKIMAAHPGDEKVATLPQEIEKRRAAKKKQLQDSWAEAVKNHDVDGSIEILKHLDLYLTPSEAEGMQETARGVFKEKIGLLRDQFTMAVQDHRWTEAIRLSETIVAEFPNSKMAQQVKAMAAMLRQ
jgi:hypothetical protein